LTEATPLVSSNFTLLQAETNKTSNTNGNTLTNLNMMKFPNMADSIQP